MFGKSQTMSVRMNEKVIHFPTNIDYERMYGERKKEQEGKNKFGHSKAVYNKTPHL